MTDLKKRIAFAVFAIIALAASYPAQAEEEIFIVGWVSSYVAGKSLTVEYDENEFRFTLSKSTELQGEIKNGALVEVEAKDGVAVYVGVVEEESPDVQK